MADSTSTNDLTYTPTTWADGADGGTAITADRLNNIEQGVAAATKQANANADSIKALGDSVSHVYQPSRPEKIDLLSINLRDKNAPENQPHAVMANDVSTLLSVPPGITSGPLYGLWDCDVLRIYEGGHAQILVTFREMVPVSGRVWTNWYNYVKWEGWKSLTPR